MSPTGNLYPATYNTIVPFLLVICGATATGKSGLALTLASRLNGVILSADSRQVYREFNIGTAKPSRMEQQQVPHYLIDICEPTETLTVADYQQQAQAIIASLHQGETPSGLPVAAKASSHATTEFQPWVRDLGIGDRGRSPLLVGGTGLYIRSITRGLKIPRVEPQLDLRSQLSLLGQLHCYTLLQQVDPASAQRIHANDQVRTLRALEVFYVTGQPISEQQGEEPPTYPILSIGLECSDTATLARRIQTRTGQMLDLGLVAEVEGLCQTYGMELPLLNTLGYQEIRQYLMGDISLPAAQELIELHTRQFAKRQRTWFRAVPEIEWFDADDTNLVDQVWQRIQQFKAQLKTQLS